ncbi:MAG: 3-methyladenine DNA glycosylase [Caeruleum heppii]|nr:MAG: 3-methyladenine DNA glycosylase [Caeruleum heppii]
MSLRRSARLGTTGAIRSKEVLSSSQIVSVTTQSKPSSVRRSNENGAITKAKANAQSTTALANDHVKRPRAPTTPGRKRRAGGDAVPVTPTPSAVGLMTMPYSTGDIDDGTPPPPTTRLAGPHRTNAPLISPESSRVVAYTGEVIDSSPSKATLSSPGRRTLTTSNLLSDACAHLLRVDPRLKPLIDKHHCRIFSTEGLAEEVDPFRSLVSGILAQQVSGAAAKAIKNRFVALFNDGPEDLAMGSRHVFPSPSLVAACDLARLRTAGLSGRKAEYIQGLAQKFATGELSARMLVQATDEEVLEKLTAVRGLGRWSVEMFACFGLKRMDVFSTGDLGVQ